MQRRWVKEAIDFLVRSSTAPDPCVLEARELKLSQTAANESHGALSAESPHREAFPKDGLSLLANAGDGRVDSSVVAWALAARDSNAVLSLDWPDELSPGGVAVSTLPQSRRFAFWHRGIPTKRRFGIVSSRLPRDKAQCDEWFRALRMAFGQLDPTREVVVTAAGATAEPYVQRAAMHFGMDELHILTPHRDDDDPAGWLHDLIERSNTIAPHDSSRWLVSVSPPLGLPPSNSNTSNAPNESQESHASFADRAIVAMADRLLAIRVRRGGNIHRLLLERLADKQRPPATVFAALGPQCVVGEVANELLQAGAVGWIVLDPSTEESKDESTGESNDNSDAFRASGPSHGASTDTTDTLSEEGADEMLDSTASEIGSAGMRVVRPGDGGEFAASPMTGDQASDDSPIATPFESSWQRTIAHSLSVWPYLTHCTRRRSGPWPGELESDFVDDLLWQREGRDRSPFAALKRMLVQSRIVASSEGIRGRFAVVSFTAAPLGDLPSLRVFRSHRARWDFEPYGIALRREWLQERGARPVVYGDEAKWSSLAEGEHPFFQMARSETPQGRSIDWTAEREWRHLGDVDLSLVPDDAAIVFVANADEADELRPACRWPVIAIHEADAPHETHGI